MSYLYRHSRDSRIDFSARVDESVRKSYLSSPEDCSAVEFDSIYLQVSDTMFVHGVANTDIVITAACQPLSRYFHGQ